MAAHVQIPFPSVCLLDVAGGNWMLHDFYALRLSPQLGQFQRGMVGGEAAMVPRSCENRQRKAQEALDAPKMSKIHWFPESGGHLKRVHSG